MQNSIYLTNPTCTEMRTQQIYSFLHVSALFECHHQGVLVSVKAVSLELVCNVRHRNSLAVTHYHSHSLAVTHYHSHSLAVTH